MNKPLLNYLRSYRQKAHLTQGEVAFLLGVTHGSTTTRHEEYLRAPSLDTALKYCAVFSVDARELFAGRYEAREESVRRQAEKLLHRLGENASPRKRAFLETLTHNPDVHYVPCDLSDEY